MNRKKIIREIRDFMPVVATEFDRLENENEQLKKRLGEIASLARGGLVPAVSKRPAKTKQPRKKPQRRIHLLPQYVRKEGIGYAAQVTRKGCTFYKSGFETPEAAHSAAVEAIKKAGLDPNKYKSRKQKTIENVQSEKVAFWECNGCGFTDPSWRLRFGTTGHPTNCPKCMSGTFIRREQKKELVSDQT